MPELPVVDSDPDAVPITAVTEQAFKAWLDTQPDKLKSWSEANEFRAQCGETCTVPSLDGGLGGIIVGLGDGKDLWAGGRLSRALPAGHYRLQELIGIEEDDRPTVATWLALAWILGAYRFERYKTEPDPAPATLVWPETADRAYVQGAALAAILTRDLINTPAEDMGPDALVAAAEDLAVAYGATFNTIVGDELLAENFPAIHAVGRAAAKAPCLIDLTWGKPDAPKVTLVGKGVCFDSGGLDIKRYCHVIERSCCELAWNSSSSSSGDGLPQAHCVVAKLA